MKVINLCVVGLSAVLGVAAFVWRDARISERQVADRPIQVAEGGYVSSQACEGCHPSEYATWYGSYHRTMTQVASPETVRADFDGVRLDVDGRSLRLERRDDEFWAEFDDPDAASTAEVRRISRQVVMITGSHHQQVYWYRTGQSRVLGQLPAMYLIAERQWIPRRAAFLRPPSGWPGSETARWNAVCIDCHATRGRPGFDAPIGTRAIDLTAVDTRAVEFGIACEACHGPADGHARANRNPLRRYWSHLTGRADDTTVLPPRLDPKRSSQVCGQCHAVWDFHDEESRTQANHDGTPYRPGDDLTRTRFVAQPAGEPESPTLQRLVGEYPAFTTDHFWSDGMIRVSGREYNGLIDSPCFKDAADPQRTLSCFSCHTMHKTADDPRPIGEWATHQVSRGLETNEACFQCHADYRAKLTAHTRHAADSSGSSCYNCHMPYTTYGLLKALRSHQISSPSVAATVETGRPNACNLCHLDKTLEWTAEQLARSYEMPKPALDADERTIAASLVWALRGDAGQRALVAWSMGWRPAQEASGGSWIAPYLAGLMGDPYDAVRFIAYRSLRKLPGFAQFPFDFMAPPDVRLQAIARALEVPRLRSAADRRTDPQLLINPDGSLKGDVINRLVQQRDLRRVSLNE